MRSEREPYLFVLRGGPVWNIEDNLRFFAEAFGREYEGEVLTRSGSRQRVRTGRFRIEAWAWGGSWVPGIVRHALYMLRCVGRGLWMRWIRGRRLVVITYDPFVTGVTGLILHWLTRAVLICEVNGVYGHPDTLIDMEDPRKALRKRRRMLRVGSFVLRRASFIKLLYPGQLVGFSLPEDDPPREAFHDVINTPVFEPKGFSAERYLIFVGHPYLLKGVDLLLEAFSRVAADFPDWKLLIVGWQIAESVGETPSPRDRVHFLGPQQAHVLSELIERSSALVLPSRSEGMGRVLLEAAFLRRARIGSRAGGIPFVLEDGVDGLLFDVGDVDDLERALRSYLGATDAERAAMGAAAAERALRLYTIEEYMRRYRKIISRLTTPAAI